MRKFDKAPTDRRFTLLLVGVLIAIQLIYALHWSNLTSWGIAPRDFPYHQQLFVSVTTIIWFFVFTGLWRMSKLLAVSIRTRRMERIYKLHIGLFAFGQIAMLYHIYDLVVNPDFQFYEAVLRHYLGITSGWSLLLLLHLFTIVSGISRQRATHYQQQVDGAALDRLALQQLETGLETLDETAPHYNQNIEMESLRRP